MTFFKVRPKITVRDLASKLGLKTTSNIDFEISGISSLIDALETELTFFSNTKYLNILSDIRAGACIIAEEYVEHLPKEVCALISGEPYADYARATNILYDVNHHNQVLGINAESFVAKTSKLGKNCSVGYGSYISENAVLGDNVNIGINCYIGPAVEIGENTIIKNNVNIEYSKIGKNCLIHTGARIGQDGFGFAASALEGLIKIPQIGNVIIEDNVEIGANTCIDRGSLGSTKIGYGTKLDNLIQIAHNVEIGKYCVIAAQTGIAGSSKIGNGVMMGGQVGIVGHINIPDRTEIAAQSGVLQDIPNTQKIGGTPAIPIKQWHRSNLILKQLLKRK